MTKVKLITNTTNGFGEEVEGEGHDMEVTIDKIRRETVTEDRNERRGYDLICFVTPNNVPKGINLLSASYLIEYEAQKYAPKSVSLQPNFGGKASHYKMNLNRA